MFKNVKKEELTIPAQMSYLIQAREFIEHIGKKYKFDDKITNSFKLVIDEACTNIIRHGYRDIKNGEITLKAIIRRSSLTIIIIDQGKSYDPRQANTPDLAKYVDIGKKGGLGILMMRKLMDDMQYTVTERGNEFRLTKYREIIHEGPIAKRWNALTLRTKYSIFAVAFFTLLSVFFFTQLYLKEEARVKNEIFQVAASGVRSLSDNVVDDVLSENSAILFESAHSLLQHHKQYIREVFLLDSSGTLLAWGNPARWYSFTQFPFPQQAELEDTLNQSKIWKYSVGDSLPVYDVISEIRLAEQQVIGQVHAWIEQKTIEDIIIQRKIRLLILLLIVLVVGNVALFMLITKILQPFHSLAQWVRDVVRGKVDQDEIDIDASDEIGEIAQAFNEMTNKFHEAQVNLMEQQKLQKELQVAQEIQQMLLPSDFPKVEGFEIASYYEAAKEVGGDLFDFVEVDDDTVGIIVADVSGKGVPGSLIMTMIRTAVRLEARGNKNPADVLTRVNSFVAEDMKHGMFVTMFYVVLDSRERIVHYASAGHNPMILYRGSTKQTYYLNPPGFPVGIQLPDKELFGRTIQTESIRLREDDILVLYTDGITEAMNANRELFREERFLDAIRRLAHLDVGEFVESINKELKAFTGGAPQNDDITFVAIKEKMTSSDVKYKVLKELFTMIDQGVKVKDALTKLRISPHQYYVYKEIVERKGMDGLKEYFESKDLVEKKHLSIEVKAKIFDIIQKHPDYGPKLIAYELRKDEYGNLRIDPDRIYDELVKLRLNTQKLRERYLKKGTKHRLKQPGTPLLTMDGEIILDFESAAQVIARRKGQAQISTHTVEKEPEKPRAVKVVTSSGEDKPGGTLMHQRAQGAYKKVEATPPTQPHSKVQAKAPAKKKELLTTKEKAPSKQEVMEEVFPELDSEKIARFFDSVKDDFQALHKGLQQLTPDGSFKEQIRKLNLILKISLKHPSLKELPDVQKVYQHIQGVLETIQNHTLSLKNEEIIARLKELLKYFKKDHKFKDYNTIVEAINQVGWLHRELKKHLQGEEKKEEVSFDQIRARLARKKIISDQSILEALNNDKQSR